MTIRLLLVETVVIDADVVAAVAATAELPSIIAVVCQPVAHSAMIVSAHCSLQTSDIHLVQNPEFKHALHLAAPVPLGNPAGVSSLSTQNTVLNSVTTSLPKLPNTEPMISGSEVARALPVRRWAPEPVRQIYRDGNTTAAMSESCSSARNIRCIGTPRPHSCLLLWI